MPVTSAPSAHPRAEFARVEAPMAPLGPTRETFALVESLNEFGPLEGVRKVGTVEKQTRESWWPPYRLRHAVPGQTRQSPVMVQG